MQKNAFTHCMDGKPIGYTPGAPVKETPMPTQYKRGGFGSTNGTIKGMGTPKPHKFNGAARK